MLSKGSSAKGNSPNGTDTADAAVDRSAGNAVPRERETVAARRVVANARRVEETRSRLAMVPIHREGTPPSTATLQQLQTRARLRFIRRQRLARNAQFGRR